MLPNLCNMAFLDTKSNAPIPSTDTTVCRGFKSVNICTMCDTHSHPDFVCNSYWCGAVASSTCFEICWAMVRAINLRMISPTSMPRMPPSCLRREVTRPNRNPSRTPLSARPWLTIVAQLQNRGRTRPIPRCVRLTCQTGPVRLHDVLNGHSCRTSQDPTRKASRELRLRSLTKVTWSWWPPLRTGKLRQCCQIPGSHLCAVQCLATY